MSLCRGGIYDNKTPGAHARQLVTLSENHWNRVMSDGIAVPVFDRGAEQAESLMLVRLDDTMFADATKIQTVHDEFWGDYRSACDPTALRRIEDGVRAFLSLEQLINERPPAPAPARSTPLRADWWPDQGMVRYVEPPIAGARKLHAVASEDFWNEIGTHWTTLRLTSRDKGWRGRWQVAVQGGHIVAGDLYATPRGAIEPRRPQPPRPASLSPTELAAIAARIRRTLEL